jgi:hypothetical protein
MANKRNKSLTIYTSLDDISIKRFDNACKGDLRWLVAEYYKGHPEMSLETFKMPDTIQSIWESLYNDFGKKVGNTDALMMYLMICEINELETVQVIIGNFLMQLSKGKPIDIVAAYYEEMSNWGFKADIDKPIDEELESLQKQLRGGQNKLERKREEYKELTKSSGEEATTLIQQKVRLTINLKMNIDIEKTSVTEWLEYWKELEQTNKKIKSHAK